MSGFGKKTEDAEGVGRFGGTLRQRAAQTRANIESTHKKKGGGSRRFGDQFKPVTVGSDKIRVVAGDYKYIGADSNGNIYEEPLQYWPYVEHYHGVKKRSIICSGGPKHFVKGQRDPCYGCDKFYAGGGKDSDGKYKKGPISKREMFAFTVWHYHKYHKIEQMDDAGVVQKNDKNEPYYNWVRCDNRGCKMCKEQKEFVEGRLLYWPMGVTHFKTLTDDLDQLIGRSCKTCGTKDSIESVAWLCDSCGEAIVDFATTELMDEQILELTAKKNRCSTCGHTGFLKELVQCNTCEEPERATIFDVDIDVKRSEGASEESSATTLMATGWSAPCGLAENLKDKIKPLDLPGIHTPTPFESQPRALGEEGASAGNPGFRDFKK